MKPWILPVVLVTLGLLVLGCGESDGPECVTNADCAGSAICLDGKCQTLGCQGGCPAGTYCDETSDECVACDVDDHCGDTCMDCSALATDRACVNGECGCRSDFHCATGQTCENGKCAGCLRDCEGKCGGADDGCGGACEDPCETGHWCNAGVCEACGECGLICQHCDDQGNCVTDCNHDECRQNVWECQCHPMPTALTCGSTAGGDLNNLDNTTDLFDTYGPGCNWPGNPLDGREATYSFGFSGSPISRQVTVTVYSVCGVSEIVGLVLAGDHPCSLDQCVLNQVVSGFV